MFNPIEQVWSLIKAYVKQELAAKIESILAMEKRDGLSITEQKGKSFDFINWKRYRPFGS